MGRDQRAGRTPASSASSRQTRVRTARGSASSTDASIPRTELATGRGSEIVERIGVLAQQVGRTRQCRNGSRPELALQNRQQGTRPNPGVCRVAVVRVHPRREARPPRRRPRWWSWPRPEGGGHTVRDGPAYRTGSAPRSLGPGPAGPAPPGRRGCDRAGQPPRRPVRAHPRRHGIARPWPAPRARIRNRRPRPGQPRRGPGQGSGTGRRPVPPPPGTLPAGRGPRSPRPPASQPGEPRTRAPPPAPGSPHHHCRPPAPDHRGRSW